MAEALRTLNPGDVVGGDYRIVRSLQSGAFAQLQPVLTGEAAELGLPASRASREDDERESLRPSGVELGRQALPLARRFASGRLVLSLGGAAAIALVSYWMWTDASDKSASPIPASAIQCPRDMAPILGGTFTMGDENRRAHVDDFCLDLDEVTVIRGSSWADDEPRYVRSAHRSFVPTNHRHPQLGFRCARSVSKR